MNLAVFTNGVMRNVSGVTPETTCAQLVYALAHATQQKGRFVLVATFNNGDDEHRVTAEEKPYNIVSECQKQNIEILFELRRLNPINDIVRGSDKSIPNLSSASPSSASGVGSDASQSLDDESTRQHFAYDDSFNHLRRSQSAEIDSDNVAAVHISRHNHHSTNSRVHSLFERNKLSHPLPQQQNIENADASSTGEDSMNCELHTKPRPPPPAYSEVIEQRCNSLIHDSRRHRSLAVQTLQQNAVLSSNNRSGADLSVSGILNMTLVDLQSRYFSATTDELESLVSAQSCAITTQKSQLLGLELTLSNDMERELVQLRKQHNNLQTVLNSLRNANWQARMIAERGEAERLHTAIDAMRTAIENKRKELHEALKLQQSLECQLALQNENSEIFQATRTAPIYS